MDYMYNACSTTARRGALDWAPVFEKANVPIFEQLYESVRNGTETRKSLEFNGRSTYREDLAKELEVINNQEIWRAGSFFLSFCLELVLTSHVRFRQDCALPAPGLQARVNRMSYTKCT
jgi:ketol-acid reductoisomerase